MRMFDYYEIYSLSVSNKYVRRVANKTSSRLWTVLRRKTDDGVLGDIEAHNSHNTKNLGFILYFKFTIYFN